LVEPDAVVIGSGPNGLAAAISVARAGRSVTVYESESTIGGGIRSAELTLPGFIHDVCSSVHPLAAASPFFNSIPLNELGMDWIYPEAALAHPFDDGTAILIKRSLSETSAQLGADERAVNRLFEPFVKSWGSLSGDLLRPARVPRHPGILARFGWDALSSAAALAARKFKTPKARAVFAGMTAHSIMPLTSPGSSAFGIMFWTMCHALGWPFARGGSQTIATALSTYLEKLGGKVAANRKISSLEELPPGAIVLCDVTPRQFLTLGGDRISISEKKKLQKFRYGPGVFKIDWSLDAPIPWNAAQCEKAGTVHLGGSLEEIIESEAAAWTDSPAKKPFALLTQPSLFDPTRAPGGKHVAWAYCHVPHA
jgi:phytoene dehydrogenase-like protein